MSKKVVLGVTVTGNVRTGENARMAAVLAIVNHIRSPANGLVGRVIRAERFHTSL